MFHILNYMGVNEISLFTTINEFSGNVKNSIDIINSTQVDDHAPKIMPSNRSVELRQPVQVKGALHRLYNEYSQNTSVKSRRYPEIRFSEVTYELEESDAE